MFDIRPAVVSDLEDIHKVGNTVPEFEVSEATVSFWPKEVLQNAIISEEVIVLVAELGPELCGFIIASYSAGLRKTTIENIYVKPDKRGQGCADALLENLEKNLREKGCDYIATLVPPTASGAIELYERRGFSKGHTFLWMDKSLGEAFST